MSLLLVKQGRRQRFSNLFLSYEVNDFLKCVLCFNSATWVMMECSNIAALQGAEAGEGSSFSDDSGACFRMTVASNMRKVIRATST